MEPRQTKKVRRRYQRWVKSFKFRRFCNRLTEKPKPHQILRHLIRLSFTDRMRKYYLTLAGEGEVGVGLILLGNKLLRAPESAAPALLLGSTDFSRAGLSYLWQTAAVITHLKETRDPSPSGQFIAEVYSDDDYQHGRFRPLPAEIDPTGNISFYDVQIQSEDLVSTTYGHETVLNPLCAFLVPESRQTGAIIIPSHIAKPLFQEWLEPAR